MPIYEFSCKGCHQVFEEWTKQVDDCQTRRCPLCGGEAERIMSNTSFLLKGGGWYVTDYGYRKGKPDESSASSPSSSESKTASGSTGGSEASATPAAAPAKSAGDGTA